MKIKRLFGILLAACVVMACFVFAAGRPSDWAEDEMDADMASLLEQVNPALNYQGSITRKEFCYIALDSLHKISGLNLNETVENPFADTNDAFVLAAYALGVVKGTSDTTFSPDSPISRQEMCVMLFRVLEAAGKDTGFSGEPLSGFSDGGQVAAWAKAETSFAVSAGIMKGVTKNRLAPLDNCQVEQALVLAARMVKNYSL